MYLMGSDQPCGEGPWPWSRLISARLGLGAEFGPCSRTHSIVTFGSDLRGVCCLSLWSGGGVIVLLYGAGTGAGGSSTPRCGERGVSLTFDCISLSRRCREGRSDAYLDTWPERVHVAWGGVEAGSELALRGQLTLRSPTHPARMLLPARCGRYRFPHLSGRVMSANGSLV